MGHARSLPVLAALVLGTVAPALAGDAPNATRGLFPGEKAPSISATDLDGKPFALESARTIPADAALAAVAEAAKAFGAKDAVKPDTALDALDGLKADGKLAPEKVAAFVDAAGKPWGVLATPASVASFKTVGDVSKWIEGSAEAPIVFVAWSSKCPTSKMYEERLTDAIASTGSRLYAVAVNANDPVDDIKAYVSAKELPYRILVDPEQKVNDVFGGKKTPHVFVLDAKNILRYSGTVDSDAAMTEPEEKRVAWLKDALMAIKDGRLPAVQMTTPVG